MHKAYLQFQSDESETRFFTGQRKNMPQGYKKGKNGINGTCLIKE